LDDGAGDAFLGFLRLGGGPSSLLRDLARQFSSACRFDLGGERGDSGDGSAK